MLDDASSPNSGPTAAADADLNRRIAAQVRELRSTAGLSLEALAQRSGVSRSMLSLIERGESSPTAVLLERVATALGVMLTDLFRAPASARGPAASPLARRADQAEWTDPASGYRRRNLTPPSMATPLQLVAVAFPPGARVTYETAAREPQVHQQLWLQQGALEVTLGSTVHRLQPGDCLAMQLDQPISFHNPGRDTAHYLVAITNVAPASGYSTSILM